MTFQAEEWVNNLYQHASTGTWSDQQDIEYNDLDQQITSAKLKAEWNCQKICASQMP